MENKLVSIIMPTFNSERTIRLSLESIRKQNFDQDLIEILVVDGGSKDKTIEISKEFYCKIIDNPRVQPEFAKYEGLINAIGKYAIFLDSDEVFSNMDSIKNRVEVFLKNGQVKNIITTGLKTPYNNCSISEYINSFGDPFSFFIYNYISSDFLKSFNNKIDKFVNTNDYIIFKFGKKDVRPIIDGGSHMFDLGFLRSNFEIEYNLIPKIFLLMENKTNLLGVLKDDYILHYSSDSLKKYLKKIKWRIINNLFYKNSAAGFVNKEEFNSNFFNIKKYLFIPYALTFILPLLVGIYFAVIRRNFIFLIHGCLTFYTGLLICYYYLLKIFNIKPRQVSYGK